VIRSTATHTFTIATLLVVAAAATASAAERPDPLAPYEGIPEGYILVQGDMLVRIDGGRGIQGAFYYNLWPGGAVPYEFDSNVNAENQQRMRQAMNELQNVCAATFIPRVGHDDYVHIQAHATENNSEVGYQGGEQIINIASWGSRFIMVHELMHTLCLKHEQARPDRDTYVVIHEDRIEDGKEHNFEKDADFMYAPYDFDSVMHYGQCAFSTCANCSADPANCRTISVKQQWAADWQDEIGQRDHLSRADIATLQCLYPEFNTVFVDHNPSQYYDPLISPLLPLGSFLNPFRTFGEGEAAVLPLGTVIIQHGQYLAVGKHSKPMRLRGPLGGVRLGN
jgi:hypothetical protein